MVLPTFAYETELSAQGFRHIVGVDEAGCGSLAGPVVAGAALLPRADAWEGVRDSKLLSPRQREAAYARIVEKAEAWGVGTASVEEIAHLNIRQATFLAMRRALATIPQADFVLVDAWKIPRLSTPQRGIVGGDRLVLSIAAGSILAKVTRDRLMREYAEIYPAYGFDIHKGYATTAHRQAIARSGPCPIHRTGWRTFQT